MFARGEEEKQTDAPNKTPSAPVRLSPPAFQSLLALQKRFSRRDSHSANLQMTGWVLLKCNSVYDSDMQIAKTRCFTDGSNSISSTESGFNIPLNRQANNCCCFLNTS